MIFLFSWDRIWFNGFVLCDRFDILQILFCVKDFTFCNSDGDVIRRSVSSSHQWSQCDLDCPEEETKGNLGQHILPNDDIICPTKIYSPTMTCFHHCHLHLRHHCHHCQHLCHQIIGQMDCGKCLNQQCFNLIFLFLTFILIFVQVITNTMALFIHAINLR